MTPQEAHIELIKSYNKKNWMNFSRFIAKYPYNNKYMDIIVQDMNVAVKFAIETGERLNEESEKLISKNCKLATKYFDSLYHKFETRWTEAEQAILEGSPNSVWNYYTSFVIDKDFGRGIDHFPERIWKEAESVFAKRMSIFHKYVLSTQKINKNYEEKILSEDNKANAKYIFEYCTKVLNARWAEAEHILMKNSDYAARYCMKFGISPPEEIHNQIIAEVAFDNTSKKSFKKKYLIHSLKKC